MRERNCVLQRVRSCVRPASTVSTPRQVSAVTFSEPAEDSAALLFHSLSLVLLLVPIVLSDLGLSLSCRTQQRIYWMRWQALWMRPEAGRERGETKGESKGSGRKWGIRVCHAVWLKTIVLFLIPEEFSKDGNSPESSWNDSLVLPLKCTNQQAADKERR